MPQLVNPLLPKSCRRDDERVFAPAALLQLCEHQTCLNRFAKAHFIGEQQSRGVSPRNRQGGLELKRKEIYRGVKRRPQLSERAEGQSACMEMMHPPPRRCRADATGLADDDGVVEWREEPAVSP
jgi:hypothetical protein